MVRANRETTPILQSLAVTEDLCAIDLPRWYAAEVPCYCACAVTAPRSWRHGKPRIEGIAEITFEYLPKPGKTKLMGAAHRGDKAAFQVALTAGDKLTDVDASGWTPLMYAASSYSGSIVSAIVKAGVDVNARSKWGETALMASAVTSMAHEDLLKAGAQVNAVSDVGMTALMLLVERGDPDEIKNAA